MDRQNKMVITIRLSEELKKELQEKADKLGISFNGLVVKCLWDYLEQK